MLILLTSKKWLTLFGVIPIPEHYIPLKLRKYKFWINRIHRALVFGSQFFYLFSLLYFLLFDVKTFFEHFEATTMTLAISLTIIMCLMCMWKKSELMEFIDDLEKLITERSRNSQIRAIYSHENEQTEKIAKFFSYFFFICTQFILLPKIFVSFYNYFTSGYSNDSFQLPIATTFPWNYQTLSGYLSAIIIQYICHQCSSCLGVCFIILFIGFANLLGALASDVKECVMDLSNKMECYQTLPAEERTEFNRNLNNAMQFHADAKEFTEKLFSTLAPILTSIFTASSTLICNSLLCLRTALQLTNFLEIGRSLAVIAYAITFLSLICSFGDRVTRRFGEIADAIGESRWYEAPLDIQKKMLTMLIVAQKSVYIQGFSNTQCTRHFLKKIIKGAFSCFLVLYEFKN